MKSQERGLQTEIKNIIVHELRAVEKRLGTKIDGIEKQLDAKIDGVEKRLDAKIDGVEKRLDAKIDSKIDIATQSFKEYTDSRFSQLNIRFDKVESRMGSIETEVGKLRTKLDISVEGLVERIEQGFGNQAKYDGRLDNHEDRIKLLESKN